MSIINKILFEIFEFQDEKIAKHSQKFFKTKKGEYGEGDNFLGVRVPQIKKIAKKYYLSIRLDEIETLVTNQYHEIRLLAIYLMIYKYEKSDLFYKKQILNIVLKNLKYFNNWDLIDTISPKIIGNFLFNKEKDLLYELVKSNNLWYKRIAVISTLYFIKRKKFDDTLKLIEFILINCIKYNFKKNNFKENNIKKQNNINNIKNYYNANCHDLLQKACGWMLREIGKLDFKVEYDFLKKWYKKMPRTMLRYAIEKFDEKERQKFLKGKI